MKQQNLSWHLKRDKHTFTNYVKATKYYKDELGKTKCTTLSLHIEIMNPNHLPNVYVDHEDHDTMNNRKSNLRISSNDENTKHRKSKNSNNKSGYRNVAIINRWYVVQLMIDGRNQPLAKFKYVDDAGEYAEKARQKYYGEFHGNS